MSTAVITGATGPIGQALIGQLLDRGDRVIALIRPGSARADALPHSPLLTVLPCALSQLSAMNPAEKADVFYHLGWDGTTGEAREDPDAQWQNTAYALDAVRLAARFGCRRFVGAGSQAEYGPIDVPIRGDTPADPKSCYGIAKYAAGKLTAALAGSLGVSHSWVRILSVYGPADSPRTLIMYVIKTLQAGGTPELTPCGQHWDYLYVTDAAAALIAVGDRGRDGAVYPIGSGSNRLLSDYVREIRDLVAPGASLAFGAKPYYPHQPMFLTADLTQLTADTGFTVQVPFAEGIRKILDTQKPD